MSFLDDAIAFLPCNVTLAYHPADNTHLSIFLSPRPPQRLPPGIPLEITLSGRMTPNRVKMIQVLFLSVGRP
jgi:hypothetical protein